MDWVERRDKNKRRPPRKNHGGGSARRNAGGVKAAPLPNGYALRHRMQLEIGGKYDMQVANIGDAGNAIAWYGDIRVIAELGGHHAYRNDHVQVEITGKSQLYARGKVVHVY